MKLIYSDLTLIEKNYLRKIMANTEILERLINTILSDLRISDEIKKEYMEKSGNYLFSNKEKPYVWIGF